MEIIGYIITFLLGLGIVAPFLLKARAILKEVGELLVELGNALEDKKITKDEIAEVIQEAQDIIGIFKK